MRRCVVIGCPGTGKTTFAIQLARLTQLPLEHLDYYYNDDRYDYPSNRPGWRKQVAVLVTKPQWIIEGNYKSTFDIRLPCADTIIYFDYPRYLAIWRALKRRVMNHNKSRPGMPTSWKEKVTPQFAKTVWQFNSKERPLIHKLLNEYQNQKTIIIFRKPAEARTYLKSLGHSHPQSQLR